YTVSLETPASLAIRSMLVRSKPCSVNMRLAASRIAAPLARSFGRPGLAGLAGAVAAGLRAGGTDMAEYYTNWFCIYSWRAAAIGPAFGILQGAAAARACRRGPFHRGPPSA